MKPLDLLFLCVFVLITINATAQTKGWTCFTNPSGDTMKLTFAGGPIVKNKKDEIFFGGTFTPGAFVGYLIKWNDTVWTKEDVNANKLNYRIVYKICIDKHDSLYTACSPHMNGHYVIAKWNGSDWNDVGTGANALNAFQKVFAICTDTADNIYVSSMTLQPNSIPFVAKWDGNTWTDITQGSMLNDTINTLCSDGAGNIYAGGFFSNSGGHFVAKWDGVSWTEVGVGTNALKANGAINSIYCDNSEIYAAGAFTNTGAKAYVAKWDGSQWSEVGAGSNALNADDEINVIYKDIVTGKLYAAGRFKNVTKRPYVAVYDGANWAELGSGTYPLSIDSVKSAYISSLCSDSKGNIYAGGFFYEKNGNGLNFMARYTDLTYLDVNDLVAIDATINVFPNPTSGILTINTTDNVQYNTYCIYNIGGIVVSSGNLTGNTTTADMRNVPAGSYILQLGKGNSYMVKVQKM